MSSNLPPWFDHLANNISKVTIKGGLAKAICYVLIFVAISMATIALSVHEVIVALFIATLLFVLVIIILLRLINLAEKYPQSALMEGAEYLAHEQMMIGSKANPHIPILASDVVESVLVTLSPEERQTLNVPEEEKPQELPAGKHEES